MKKSLVIVCIMSVLCGLLPFLIMYVRGGVPQLPVEIVDDTLYYLSRAREVSEGHVTVANQYIKEHNESITPAFFVADWFTSIPFFFGFDAVSVQIINQTFWFFIFGFVLYMYFRKHAINAARIPWAVLLVLCCVYWYEARPTVMQIVYPYTVLFLIVVWDFIKESYSKKNQVLLMCVIAGSLYIYTYLAICVCSILGILFLIRLYKKQYAQSIHMVVAGCGALLLSVPFFIYTRAQLADPLYRESFQRIGLIETHLIGGGALYYVSILVLIVCFTLYAQKEKIIQRSETLYAAVVSGGLFFSLISNIFTGKEFELASHIGRFVDLWLVLIVVFLCDRVFVRKPETRTRYVCFLFLGTLGVFVVYGFFLTVGKWQKVYGNFSEDRYVPVLTYIQDTLPPESVIFAGDILSSYIPLATSHYVLFHPQAQLYLVSNKEIEERYLLSRMFTDLTYTTIVSDFRKYAGVGNAIHTEKIHNRAVMVCKVVYYKRPHDCGSVETAAELKGSQYFESLIVQYKDIQKNSIRALKKFNVSYIVVDKENDAWVIPNDLHKVWEHGSFKVYMVSN